MEHLDAGQLIELKFKKTAIKYEILDVQMDLDNPELNVVGFKMVGGKRKRFIFQKDLLKVSTKRSLS